MKNKQDLEEEYKALKKEWKEKRLKYPKAYSKILLEDIRKLERQLEIPVEKWVDV